jgi:hypothetical protein
VGFISVFLNGVLLGSADYTATNGTTVVLATGAAAGNLVTVESFQVSSVLNAIPNTAGAVSSSNIQTSVALTTPTMTSPTISSGPLTIGTTALGAGDSSAMKNRIINGAMVIDQRNAGALVNPMADSTYYLDRWRASATQTGKLSIGQNAGSVTPPVGFTNYMGFTSLSAYSITSGDIFGIAQNIEGYNVADLGWGTANAKTVTLSFQVYSSLTGTFGGSLRNSASSRSYPFSYTVSSANTWTSVSITIAGDTSGTWLTTNGIGILLFLSLGSGSTYSGTAGSWSGNVYTSATGATSVVGTNGATFYITGVQLEVGSNATGFEYRQYGTELALCQRYFVGTAYGNMGICTNATTNWNMAHTFPVAMRASPTLYGYTGTFGTTNAMTDSYAQDYILTTGVGSIANSGTTGARTSGWITNNAGAGGRIAMWNNSTAVIQFSAEL